MPTGELRTDDIIHDALANRKVAFLSAVSPDLIVPTALSDKQVFIPYTPPMAKGQAQPPMQMLSLDSVQDFESLIPNKWKIREMAPDTLQRRTHGTYRN